MSTKLFVGKLSYDVNDASLLDMFKEFGEVSSANVIIDRDTNRSKGFGFVEMAKDEDAKKAISALNGKSVNGFNMVVSEARPREERPGRQAGFRRSW